MARLDDDKAEDIVFIDLKDKSAFADSLIVASGRSHRHVGALANVLPELAQPSGQPRALPSRGAGDASVQEGLRLASPDAAAGSARIALINYADGEKFAYQVNVK